MIASLAIQANGFPSRGRRSDMRLTPPGRSRAASKHRAWTSPGPGGFPSAEPFPRPKVLVRSCPRVKKAGARTPAFPSAVSVPGWAYDPTGGLRFTPQERGKPVRPTLTRAPRAPKPNRPPTAPLNVFHSTLTPAIAKGGVR